MRSKIFMLCTLIIFSGINIGLSQRARLNQIGTSMANFLKIGIGARPTAMGDAYVALSDDINSLYWNPGGLSRMEGNAVMFQSTNWLLDTKLYFLGVAYQFYSFGTLGFSLTSLSSGEIEETTIWEPDGTGRKFDAADLAAGLTYSRRITERFSFGVTLKYIMERLDRETAKTIAMDIGSVFTTNFFNDMRIGFTLSNLGGRLKLDGSDLTIQHQIEPSIKYIRAQLGTEPWDIPLLFRFGVATDVFRKDNYRLTISTEVMDSRDFSARISMGGEMVWDDLLFLRGGYKFRDDESNYSLGLGLKVNISPETNLRVDYAYTNFGILNNVQRFTVIIQF